MKTKLRKENPEKTKDAYRKIFRDFIEKFKKTSTLAEYNAVSKDYEIAINKMNEKDPKVFHELYSSHAAAMNAKFAAMGRLTGTTAPRI
ncbi:MAG: hypothetical protein PHV13_03170 [Candidatus ainarchaeum sp.]|nr:hypothetical protein [Candidatus ainarchaeum sp.]